MAHGFLELCHAPAMQIHHFSLNSDTLRGLFAPRKPRHPLLRFALGLVGVGLLLVLLVVGAVVGTTMLLAGLVLRLWRGRNQPLYRRPQAADVVEGEYRVVGKSALPLGR